MTLSTIHGSILLRKVSKTFTFLLNTNNKNNKKGAIYMFKRLNGEMSTVYGEMLYNGTYEGNDFSTYEEYYNNNYEQYADMQVYKDYTMEHED